MQDSTAFSAPPLTQLNYLASTSPEVAKSVLRNRGMLDAVDPSVFGGGPLNGKKRLSDPDAGRMSSPEPVEDSEDEAVDKDDPPSAKRPQDNQRNLRAPPLKTIKLVPPMLASSRDKRSTKKTPLPPPASTSDLKGPSAFPSLLTDLSKYKPGDGIKPLGRGFSKGKEDAIPGAFFECENCGETKTPLWRRSEKNELLCNACGLYVRTVSVERRAIWKPVFRWSDMLLTPQHGEHRPIQQAKASRDKRTTVGGETGDCEFTTRLVTSSGKGLNVASLVQPPPPRFSQKAKVTL
jgi:transcription elongation factor Elf1